MEVERFSITFVLQDNWSALLFAAKSGALEISIELLERGASLEHRDLVRTLLFACWVISHAFIVVC